MDKIHTVESVSFRNGNLILRVDGVTVESALSRLSEKLANASPEQLEDYEVSPGGYGIHWPSLDEDIAIYGLLGITHHPDEDRRSA